MNPALKEYLDGFFIPVYSGFDGGHNEYHYRTVTANIIAIVQENPDMEFSEDYAYVIAAYHDYGMTISQANHSFFSKQLFLQDSAKFIQNWSILSGDIEMLAQAIEDHTYIPSRGLRNKYSELLYYADKIGVPGEFAKRSILYNLKHNPHFTKEEMFENAYSLMPRNKLKPSYGKFFKSRLFDSYQQAQMQFQKMSKDECYAVWLSEYQSIISQMSPDKGISDSQ